ncbi:MAG: SusC/RagA family TonB-linked outer membrane protein, partial [Muribaculaceae bacterium]|nr:SusC/RagA family TonB-linked outer membrane protein [Muribaculaceae bacterium]
RYLLTATIRRDGSSKFGSNNKWGTFPSVALAWRINQEKWFEDVTWLNNLKLRLGYGKVGNSNIDTYRYGSAMQTVLTPFGTGYIPQNLANPNIKWEASEQYNVGLDFAVLDNRLSFTVDWYRKQTQDLLMQMFVPGHLGPSGDDTWGTIAPPYANVGQTRNTGIDVQINAIPVTTKDFHWSSSVTLSHNRNKIVALNEDSQIIYGKIDWFSEFATATMFKVGEPMGVFYGYETDGLFQNEAEIVGWATQTGASAGPYANKVDKVSGAWIGDIKFVDQNGDGIIDDADQKVIGDPNPDLVYGWTNTFNYKDFELNIGLQGQFGGDILNWARSRVEGLSSIWDNQSADVLNRAQAVRINPNGGDEIANLMLAPGSNGLPRFSNLDTNMNQRMSDRWIEDATYLRIQNISLAYNLPAKWAKKAFLQNAKLYFNVQNVYTFTKYKGYDPEIGAFNQSSLLQNIDRGRYPTPRTYTLGLNLSF